MGEGRTSAAPLPALLLLPAFTLLSLGLSPLSLFLRKALLRTFSLSELLSLFGIEAPSLLLRLNPLSLLGLEALTLF